jgi:site-specific recombinase XerD
MRASKAVELFLLSCRGSKSPQTIIWYERRLSALVLFLGDVKLADVTIQDLRRWRAALVERNARWVNHPSGRRAEPGGLSMHTLHGYVRAVRRFFRWLEDEGMIVASPARRLELPRLPRGIVKGIAQQDLSLILEAARQSSPRDLALAWFFYSTACRVGGAVNLRLGDLRLERGLAYVHEKFDKTRPVFLLPAAVEAMRAWLDIRPDSDDDHATGGSGTCRRTGCHWVC